jgi:hypothetical protein
MTAINVIRQRDAVHILTDGASYDHNGTMAWPGPKVWPMPHLNAVLAVSGSRMAPGMLVEGLSAIADSFDELKDKAAEAFRTISETFTTSGAPLGMVIAGWGVTGADSYVVTNHSFYPGVDPFAVTSMGPIAIIPGEVDMQDWVDGMGHPVETADDIDPVVDGLALLELQRAAKVPVAGNPAVMAKIVGAFAQLTTVHRDGEIRTRILRRWNDHTGTKVASLASLAATANAVPALPGLARKFEEAVGEAVPAAA